MLERLMQRAEQAEVFEIESEATKIGFEANKVKSYSVEEERGIAARVVVEGRRGFAASSDLAATDRVVANALESARYGDPISLAFPGAQPGPEVQVYDESLVALSPDKLIEIGKQIIEIVVAADADVLLNMDLERRVRQTTVRNSTGAEVVVRKAPFSIQVTVERVRGDDVLILFEYFTTATKDEAYRAGAQRIARKIRLAEREVDLNSGRMPVLFSPTGALAVGLPIMQALNGKDVYRGISPVKGRIGETLFDPRLTVVDDPTLDGRPGSGSHDDEGTARRRLTLIDHGVLRRFIYDLETAARAGAAPTGHGERSLLFRPPAPSFSNLVFESGDTAVADIIAGIDEGLLVEDPLGLGQGNVIGGDFSNNLSLAFKIEAGEIVGRVKDAAIAGNVYEDLRQIEAISQEAEWVYGGIRMPYILVPELNVVTKSG